MKSSICLSIRTVSRSVEDLLQAASAFEEGDRRSRFLDRGDQGAAEQGNLFSRYGIHKIVLKERGTSTLGGQQIWYDEDVHRLNTDGRGVLLGEFQGDDKLIVRTAKNVYYTTNFDITQHFPDDTVHVSKYSPDTVYAVAYFDRSQNYYYLKRFTAEQGEKMQSFLDEDADLVAVTSCPGAVLVLTFQGAQASRPAEEIDVDGFVGVKSHRAKASALRPTTWRRSLSWSRSDPSGRSFRGGCSEWFGGGFRPARNDDVEVRTPSSKSTSERRHGGGDRRYRAVEFILGVRI